MTTATEFIAAGFRKMDADLRFFMECLREVLVEIGQPAIAGRLPWLDESAGGGPGGWEPGEPIEQAVSIAFQLLNVVEESAAERTRVLREAEAGPSAEPGCWGAVLGGMAGRGGPEGIWGRIRGVRVEPVLTAHPTEAKRAPVLGIHRELAELAERIEAARAHPSALEALREETRTALERLWRCGEILFEKPSVADERASVLHYLTEIFPRALPRLDARLLAAWRAAGLAGPHPSEPADWPTPEFGSWVGGDRDGHPLVTAEVTAATLAEMRRGALGLVAGALRRLASRLPLSLHFQSVPSALHGLLEELRARAPSSRAGASEEPWKQAAQLMAEGVEQGLYASPAELDAQLRVLGSTLEEVGAGRLVRSEVWPVRRLLHVFGFHLARLDIRQNSAFHDRAIAQILAAAGEPGADYPTWPEQQRLEFLERELRSPRPFLFDARRAGPEAAAVLDCYAVLRREIQAHGPGGIGALIVSMTRSLSDLLGVYLLAREGGLLEPTSEGPVCHLPVVPLFETLEDLDRAPDLLGQFLDHPLTQRGLRARAAGAGNRGLIQQVMIGYSDSNKDCGILASQHALRQAQAEMAEAAAGRGVRLVFFHGRGGTTSRGAGPTHRFLAALPKGTVCGHLRLTEQGETIAQKYSKISTAVHHLELLLAGAAAYSRGPQDGIGPIFPWRRAWEILAPASHQAYRRLVEHPGFLDFYSQATPIDALETSRIGSRPSRRDGQRTLGSLRAIPWVFSWNQSRFFLPGWYGTGTALEALKRQEPEVFEEMRVNPRRCPFSYYVFTNVETNAVSADEEIMRLYAGLVGNAGVREALLGLILDELERTRRMLAELLGSTFAQRRPRMDRTLALRAGALRILHERQVAILREWRTARGLDEEAAARLFPRVMLSINAIASGLRTTG